MALKIVWTSGAQAEFDEICGYIAKDSERYALRMGEQFIAQVEWAAQYPLAGAVMRSFRRFGVRQTFCGQYRIIYRVVGATLRVLAIRHGARRVPRDVPFRD